MLIAPCSYVHVSAHALPEEYFLKVHEYIPLTLILFNYRKTRLSDFHFSKKNPTINEHNHKCTQLMKNRQYPSPHSQCLLVNSTLSSPSYCTLNQLVVPETRLNTVLLYHCSTQPSISFPINDSQLRVTEELIGHMIVFDWRIRACLDYH